MVIYFTDLKNEKVISLTVHILYVQYIHRLLLRQLWSGFENGFQQEVNKKS